MSEVLAAFRGPVEVRRAAGPLGLTLSGDTRERPGERTALAFSASAPADFPEALDDAVVEELGAGQYRIATVAREWRLAAAAVHLHREVAAQFYRAIRPRSVPLGKRLFWQLVLALAASRTGIAILRALRRSVPP